MKTTPRWYGWHFLAEDRRLRYGAREVVEAGRTYTAEGPLSLCGNGMHASKRALDALGYAPGPWVCWVELRGERLDETDKSCARERPVLWMADATTVLHQFAVTVATDVLHLVEAVTGEAIDARCWQALAVKERWLRGQASDAELAASRAASWAVQNDILTIMLKSLR